MLNTVIGTKIVRSCIIKKIVRHLNTKIPDDVNNSPHTNFLTARLSQIRQQTAQKSLA